MHRADTYDKWIEIDTAAVEQNLAAVRSRLHEGVRLMAVLKANAYGHGAVGMARLLAERGVDIFAVSHLREALELRAAEVQGDILLFLPLAAPEDIRSAAEHGLSVSVGCAEDIAALEAALTAELPPLKVHLQVDTGLGRFGFLNQHDLPKIAQAVRDDARLELTGIYTHMADAGNDPAYTRKQYETFTLALAALAIADIHIPLRHCANSATLLNHPAMQLDAVRVGTLLCGQHPVGDFAMPLDLQDPFHFKTRLIALRRLPKGSYLGYYRTYRLKREALVGVIPVGYRDGLLLEVANPPLGAIDLLKTMLRPLLYRLGAGRFRHTVRCRGQEWPLVGKVFMQMALIEFPAAAAVKLGDEVEVPVRKVLAPPELPRVYRAADFLSTSFGE